MKIEEQTKVKAMIDGINKANQQNIESLEDGNAVIYQNSTIKCPET